MHTKFSCVFVFEHVSHQCDPLASGGGSEGGRGVGSKRGDGDNRGRKCSRDAADVDHVVLGPWQTGVANQTLNLTPDPTLTLILTLISHVVLEP